MRIHITGFGVMGRAIALRLLEKKQYKIFVSDKTKGKLKALRGQIKADLGFKFLPEAEVIILAVKPQDLAMLAKEIGPKISSQSILVSIAAGVSLTKLKAWFKHKQLVRVMPNLGLSVGFGIAAWKATGLSAKNKRKVLSVLSDICEAFEVKTEKAIDAVTAVSGSGPAYFFYLSKAIEEAALGLGLGAEVSKKLVKKTLWASAALQGEADYQDLIEKIASKKGTTEAALLKFKQAKLKSTVKQAVRAAFLRAGGLQNG